MTLRRGRPPGDYEVGYGKPPVHSRFKPGQSGRTTGKSKPAPSLKTDLQEALLERVPVTMGGKVIKTTMQQLLVRTALAKAVKGDMRATSLILQLMDRILEPESAGARKEVLSPEDQQILDALLAEAQRADGENAP